MLEWRSKGVMVLSLARMEDKCMELTETRGTKEVCADGKVFFIQKPMVPV